MSDEWWVLSDEYWIAPAHRALLITSHSSRVKGKKMTENFTIFPAIDLRAGKIVRLAQGDPDRQTIYGDNPRQQAEIFKAAGAC